MSAPRIVQLESMELAKHIAELYGLHDGQHDIIEMLLESVRLLNNRVVELEKRNGLSSHDPGAVHEGGGEAGAARNPAGT